MTDATMLLADNYTAYMGLLAYCGCGPKTKVFCINTTEL